MNTNETLVFLNCLNNIRGFACEKLGCYLYQKYCITLTLAHGEKLTVLVLVN